MCDTRKMLDCFRGTAEELRLKAVSSYIRTAIVLICTGVTFKYPLTSVLWHALPASSPPTTHTHIQNHSETLHKSESVTNNEVKNKTYKIQRSEQNFIRWQLTHHKNCA